MEARLKKFNVLLLGAFCFFLFSAQLDLKTILKDFSSLDFLYQPLPAKSGMISTYDRTGGNADGDNFLKIENERAVLAELKGSGIITRIFSAHPRGIIQIYLDDKKEPRVSLSAQQFFSGKIYPFISPLVGSSAGAYCYFPIPFSKGARIEIKAEKSSDQDRFGLYWQVEYLTFPENWRVKSFSLPLSQKEKTALNELINFLYELKRFKTPASAKKHEFVVKIPAKKRILLAELKGPGIIRKFELELIPQNPKKEKELLCSKLYAFWDNEPHPSISAKALSFFSNPFDERSPYILLKRTARGGVCLFPMPFSRNARFELENTSLGSGKAILKIWLEEKAPNSPFRFHAFERKEKLKAYLQPKNLDHKNDYLVLQAEGQGRLVALSLWVLNKYLIWWGEGDESIFIDGRLAWHGTGTEDYFDGSYKRFANYLFACSLVESSFGKDYAGITLAVRFHLLDPVYFQKSLVMKFEHGRFANDLDNWYGSVAYWYQREPHLDFSQMSGEEIELSKELVEKEVKKALWKTLPTSRRLVVILFYLALVMIFVFCAFIFIRKKIKGGVRSG